MIKKYFNIIFFGFFGKHLSGCSGKKRTRSTIQGDGEIFAPQRKRRKVVVMNFPPGTPKTLQYVLRKKAEAWSMPPLPNLVTQTLVRFIFWSVCCGKIYRDIYASCFYCGFFSCDDRLSRQSIKQMDQVACLGGSADNLIDGYVVLSNHRVAYFDLLNVYLATLHPTPGLIAKKKVNSALIKDIVALENDAIATCDARTIVLWSAKDLSPIDRLMLSTDLGYVIPLVGDRLFFIAKGCAYVWAYFFPQRKRKLASFRTSFPIDFAFRIDQSALLLLGNGHAQVFHIKKNTEELGHLFLLVVPCISCLSIAGGVFFGDGGFLLRYVQHRQGVYKNDLFICNKNSNIPPKRIINMPQDILEIMCVGKKNLLLRFDQSFILLNLESGNKQRVVLDAPIKKIHPLDGERLICILREGLNFSLLIYDWLRGKFLKKIARKEDFMGDIFPLGGSYLAIKEAKKIAFYRLNFHLKKEKKGS